MRNAARLLLLGLPFILAASVPLPVDVVADIPLPGRATRGDYASLDETTHRLFLAHMGDDAVAVVDVQGRRAVANIGGIENVHGVLAVPEQNRIYATATGANQLQLTRKACKNWRARRPAIIPTAWPTRQRPGNFTSQTSIQAPSL